MDRDDGIVQDLLRSRHPEIGRSGRATARLARPGNLSPKRGYSHSDHQTRTAMRPFIALALACALACALSGLAADPLPSFLD